MRDADLAEFRADLSLMRDAVREAGAAAMRYFQADPKVWEKEGHGPVSEADFAANEVLQSVLCSARPEYGWLSEETTDDPARLSNSHLWIVDPIDGTRAFIEGKTEFTICAALAVDGMVVAGSVLNPATGEHFEAAQGIGAHLNGEPIKVLEPGPLDKPRALTTRKVMKPEFWQGDVPDLERGYVNSIAYRLCLVASGRWHAALSANGFSEWDTAAAQIIIEEAGGLLTDWQGHAFRYNNPKTRLPGLLAGAPKLHASLRAQRRLGD